jgi:serine/threonine protein kinase
MNPERWGQIKQIYYSALELEPGRREGFLKEACAGDESLLKEVTSLLAQKGNSEGLFESPALEAVARALAEDEAHKPHPSLGGRTILHYHIKERIGEGGMGVIYKAEDTNLHRQVAIKVLPEGFTHDTERLARFKREAQVLASLNHPNIATLHGLEEFDGQRFIVMELVEGQTLARRLLKGPLPVEEALELCRQIAEGLEAAHGKGIIHRDLKPDNIMVSPDDKVKILDFGLAKALESESQAADAAKSPPITEVKTRAGTILGTAAYMSPEQAKGKPVDKRADIWAFGCILYECLAGRRAFHGDTVTETVAAVLRGEPDWAALPAETPLPVRAALRQCLQKDPAYRLHDIADAFVVINDSAAQSSEEVTSFRRFSLWWIAGSVAVGVIAVALVTIALMKHLQVAPSAPVTRSIIRIDSVQWLAGMGRQPEFWRPSRNAMAISSDGRFIVYSAIEGEPSPQAVPRLYFRWTDRMEAKPIAGTEGGIGPFLSPDNRWLGFWADGKLNKVPVEGGIPGILGNVSLSAFSAPFGAC